jgi:hypothetical protein
MVDVHAEARMPSMLLQRLDDRRPTMRVDEARDVQSADVNRLLASAGRDLVATDNEKLFLGGMQGIKAIDVGQKQFALV